MNEAGADELCFLEIRQVRDDARRSSRWSPGTAEQCFMPLTTGRRRRAFGRRHQGSC